MFPESAEEEEALWHLLPSFSSFAIPQGIPWKKYVANMGTAQIISKTADRQCTFT